MADFSVNATQLSAPQGAGSQVLSPVQTPQESSNMGLLGGIVDIFAKGLVDTRKAKAEAQSTAVITDFNQKMDAIASAKAAGTIDSAKAGLLSRKLYSTSLANHATETDALTKSWKAFSGGTEIGEAQTEEQKAKQVLADGIAAAQKDGFYISPDASEKTKELAIVAHTSDIAFNKEMQRKQAAITEQRAKESHATAQTRAKWDAEDRYIKKEATDGLNRMYAANYDTAVSAAEDVIKNPKLNPEQKQLELGLVFDRVINGAIAVSKKDPSLAAPYIQMLKETKSHFVIQSDTSKASSEEVKNLANEKEKIILKNQLVILATPQMAAGAAMSKLFSESPAIALKLQPVVLEYLIKSGSLEKDGVSAPLIIGTEGHKEVLDVIGKELKNNALTPAARGELSKSLDTVMKQVGESGKLTMEQYSDISQMTAGSGFLKAVQEGAVSQENMDMAQHAMAKRYVEVVKVKLDTALSNPATRAAQKTDAFRADSKQLTVADMVNINFQGGRVILQEKGSLRMGLAPSQETEAKEAGQMLTQLIHSGAHMEGSNNYEAYWEKNKHKLLPKYFPDPAVLKVGGTLKGKDGKSYRYNGGNFNDIKGSFTQLPSGE